jgi:tRNA threonylcarbamoyladenosine biosynthesis protein TsaB
VRPGLRLAIDSATDRLSVAADSGPGTVVVQAAVPGARRHASTLLGLIEEVLGRLGAGPEALSVVAVSDGPGSFTGLRVGISVAKALALGSGVPLVTAPSLLVRAAGSGREGERVLAVTSALRGEVYGGAWHLVSSLRVARLFEARAIGSAQLGLLPLVDRVVGDCPQLLVDELRAAVACRFTDLEEAWPSASSLLGLIGVDGGESAVSAPAIWEPTYGRPAEAQAKWEREHGRPLPDPGSQAS